MMKIVDMLLGWAATRPNDSRSPPGPGSDPATPGSQPPDQRAAGSRAPGERSPRSRPEPALTCPPEEIMGSYCRITTRLIEEMVSPDRGPECASAGKEVAAVISLRMAYRLGHGPFIG